MTRNGEGASDNGAHDKLMFVGLSSLHERQPADTHHHEEILATGHCTATNFATA